MKRLIAAAFAMLMLLAALPSFAGELDEDERDTSRGVLPPGASVQRDLAYGSDARQRVDVYLPAQRSGGVIVMVHGGGWHTGDKAMRAVVEHKVAHWLPRGIVFVSVGYRLIPQADPLAQADDVARALAFVQARAREWGADPARVVLMGHSAGAHLVALLSADRSIAERHGAKPWLGTVPLDSAAFDVEQIMRGRHFRLYDRAFGRDSAYWREASPLHRLQVAPPPMLLVCSSRRSDSCPQAEVFAGKGRALGARLDVLAEPLSHRDVNLTLGEPGAYTDVVDAFLRTLGLP
jgi:acetyl esterase/lipase